MGCRALSVSLIKLFTEIIPNARIILVYGNEKPSEKILDFNGRTVRIEVQNFRLSPRAKLSEHLIWILLLSILHRIVPPLRSSIEKRNKLIRTLLHADIIGDIRGGDSFSDIYGMGRLFFPTIPICIVTLLRKKFVLLPQTYGPYRSIVSRILARFTINAAGKVLTRDHNSIGVIKEKLGIKNREIEFCPDVAFALQPIKPNWFTQSYKRNGSSLIGFNISGLLFNGGYTQNNMFSLKFDYKDLPNKLIIEILMQTTADIIMVPHVFSSGVESDLTAAQTVYSNIPEEYKSRVLVIDHFADQSELKYIIGICDFFIGSRMHACIAALSQGIPTVGIAYSHKFKGVFESVGLGDNVIDARSYGIHEINDFCLKRYKLSRTIVKELNNNMLLIRETLNNCFQNNIHNDL